MKFDYKFYKEQISDWFVAVKASQSELLVWIKLLRELSMKFFIPTLVRINGKEQTVNGWDDVVKFASEQGKIYTCGIYGNVILTLRSGQRVMLDESRVIKRGPRIATLSIRLSYPALGDEGYLGIDTHTDAWLQSSVSDQSLRQLETFLRAIEGKIDAELRYEPFGYLHAVDERYRQAVETITWRCGLRRPPADVLKEMQKFALEGTFPTRIVLLEKVKKRTNSKS